VGAVSNDEAKSQLLLRLAATPLMGDLISPLLIDSRALMRWRMKKVYAQNGNARLFDKKRMRSHHLPLRCANTQRAVLRTLRRWSASRVEREAHLITQPTLLIWGEEDRDIPLRHGERLHGAMPNARLVVFRNCAHLPQEERPAEFAGLVAGFCRGATAATTDAALGSAQAERF
jgi:pimeloyl-ACP methyl ester carboxylesterase